MLSSFCWTQLRKWHREADLSSCFLILGGMNPKIVNGLILLI